MRKNAITIMQFAPHNWVVEGIGEIMKSKLRSLLTHSRAASHCKKHHLQSRADIDIQGQPSAVNGSQRQLRVAICSQE
jgi:hypothetical protein